MKLTVVQTLPALEVGGVERGTLEVAEELVKHGHRSIVISAGGRLVKELTDAGSEHIELPIGKKSLFTPRYIPTLRNIMRREQATILHSCSRMPAWISYLAWRGMDPANRPRFITAVHGANSISAYSKIMTYGERVITVSEFIHAYIIRNYPDIDPKKVIVIPRGVSPQKFPYNYKPDQSWIRMWQEQYPFLQGKFLLTLPGRISRRKGLEDFIEIISRLKSSGLNIHGLIVGGPHVKHQRYFDELKKKTIALSIADNISFTGHRDDIREIFSISDLILTLSNKPESFGRTALEALSLGMPVVAYDHGGVSEILQAIFPEGLIRQNDTGAAIKLITQFYKNRPHVPDHNPFTLQRTLDNTIEFYEETATNN